MDQSLLLHTCNMTDRNEDSFGRLLAVVLSEGSGVPDVPHAWRLGGITSVREVGEWVECGVYDAHRAGVLRAAGIRPQDIAGIKCQNGVLLGRAYALGVIGLNELVDIVGCEKLEGTG